MHKFEFYPPEIIPASHLRPSAALENAGAKLTARGVLQFRSSLLSRVCAHVYAHVRSLHKDLQSRAGFVRARGYIYRCVLSRRARWLNSSLMGADDRNFWPCRGRRGVVVNVCVAVGANFQASRNYFQEFLHRIFWIGSIRAARV